MSVPRGASVSSSVMCVAMAAGFRGQLQQSSSVEGIILLYDSFPRKEIIKFYYRAGFDFPSDGAQEHIQRANLGVLHRAIIAAEISNLWISGIRTYSRLPKLWDSRSITLASPQHQCSGQTKCLRVIFASAGRRTQ
jgi:hypothetical protein